MTPSVATARTSGLFDPAYYEEVIAKPFREGVIDEAPVLPGTGMFMPAGTAAGKNKGIFRRDVPIFDPTGCTACMECAIACPDNAIPNSGHEIGDLLRSAVASSGLVDADAGRPGSRWFRRGPTRYDACSSRRRAPTTSPPSPPRP